MGYGFISTEEADISSDVKVCCKEFAEDLKNKTKKMIVGKLKTKSTIDGGPSYFEKYELFFENVDKCDHCGKDITGKQHYLVIIYKEKNK